MDLSAGRRVGYDIDSLLGGPSTSDAGADDRRTPAVTCHHINFSPGSQYRPLCGPASAVDLLCVCVAVCF